MKLFILGVVVGYIIAKIKRIVWIIKQFVKKLIRKEKEKDEENLG